MRSFDPVAGGPRPRLRGPLPRGREPADQERRGGRRDRRRLPGPDRRDHQAREAERKERAPLLYDLTSLQRDANSRFGFSARRTLAAAQRLYEEHKALTYPRTNSRYLTGDMIPEIKPIAQLRRRPARVRRRPRSTCSASTCCRSARVVNDAKVTDHHAIIPTRAERHPVDKMDDDDRRIYDLVVRRFLAIFHPDAVFENTRVETTVASTCSAPAAS